MRGAKGSQSDTFRFRKHDIVGAADAEDDLDFLRSCFIDTGSLRVLKNCADPRRIVLGRTGSGKTALLKRLAEAEERVIEVHPESLSLGYISNSTILRFFSSLGVNLDIFFKLLWRHVFTVEILKHHTSSLFFRPIQPIATPPNQKEIQVKVVGSAGLGAISSPQEARASGNASVQ